MRRLSRLLWIVVALQCTSAWASASFANRGIGAGVAGFKIFGDGAGVEWGIPISLEYTQYLESGFELFAHLQGMIVQVPTGVPETQGGRGAIFGFGGHAGGRYLFLEEEVRPYVALHLSVLGLVLNPVQAFVGAGVTGGVEIFLNDSISLGVRGTFDTFFALNKKPLFSVGGGLALTTYF